MHVDSRGNDVHNVNQRTCESSGIVIRGFTFVVMVLAAVTTIMQTTANVDTSASVLHSLET
jgi:hypothetical protein